MPMLTAVTALSIPSPSDGVWDLGPVPIRGYALAIILGIVAAVWIGERRWVARGGRAGEIQDLAIWAVPFGLVGGRIYHVLTDSELYFGSGGNAIEALYVWRGGLGVWGAIALGAFGVVIGARRAGIKLLPVLDAMAPGVLVAQAIGRWGNWFNQELFGKPTDLPWGLEIDSAHRPAGYADPDLLFHPTFLYESLWCLLGFALVVWADKRFRLGHGRVVALYVMVYTAGRGFIEMLRIDSVELDNVLGLRFNVWTSIVLFVLALAYFVVSARRHPGREEAIYVDGRRDDDVRSETTDEQTDTGQLPG
ncbi:prolipoprotein diacylglyceryl transferase [Nocardioides caricicola]